MKSFNIMLDSINKVKIFVNIVAKLQQNIISGKKIIHKIIHFLHIVQFYSCISLIINNILKRE